MGRSPSSLEGVGLGRVAGWLIHGCCLYIVLVQVQRCIQFGLFHQQFFQPCLMFEGLCQFRSKSRQVPFELLKLFPLAFRGPAGFRLAE